MPSIIAPVAVATFYRFTPLDERAALRRELLARCRGDGLTGTILLAPEGLNAGLAGSRAALEALVRMLERLPGCAGLEPHWGSAPAVPWRRLKVRLKRELVNPGAAGLAPHRQSGIRVPPARFNALLRDPRVQVLDARNDYEHRIGSFTGARAAGTESFRDFARAVLGAGELVRERPVAMFCTGGIRCEKATALLLEQGFSTVYQLDGGILRYLETIPAGESLWQGDCFVFDERVALDARLAPADYLACPGCRRPVSRADRRSPRYLDGVTCPACHDRLSDTQRRAFAERARQQRLALARGEPHLGARMTPATRAADDDDT